jgi:hypothetical protein
MYIILEGDHLKGIWTKFGFIPSSGSADFQTFLTFQLMAALLDVKDKVTRHNYFGRG